MSNQYLKLRRSSVPGKTPDTASLDFGEIALNTYDGLAFMKKSGSAGIEIVTLGSGGSTINTGSFATTGSNTFIGNQIISGSLIVTSITGSLLGTASLALQVSTSISTQNQQHNVLFTDTSGPGYIQVDGGLRYNPNQDLLTTTASFALNAATASSADNFTVRGTLTATTIVAQTITASTEFITGSSRFGSLSTNTHQFTGSVSVTGSLAINGNNVITSNQTSSFATTGSNTFSGNQIISGSGINTILQVHGANAEPWAFGIYNDTYNPTQLVLAGFVDNTGEANIGTEVDKPLYIYTNATYNAPTLIISSSGVTFKDNILVNGITVGRGKEAGGAENTAVGLNVLKLNNGGAANVAVGERAMEFSVGGEYNTAVGYYSLQQSDGLGNTAIGYQTLTRLPSTSNTYYNTAVGYNAGYNLLSGQNNIFLGIFPEDGLSLVNASNNTIIGSNIAGLSSSLSNNIILSDGQGNIKYRWDETQNNIYGNLYITGSVSASNGFTGSLLGTASNAATASSADNFTVRGTLTATTIVAQTITASTEFITGSSRFGSLVTDTHQFTGSVSVTGSLAVNGNSIVTSNQTSSFVQNNQTSSFVLNSQTSSMSVLSASYASGSTSASFAQTASYVNSLNQTVQITGSLNISGSTSGSLFVNGLTTFTGNISGSQPSNNPSSSLILISGNIRPTGSLSGSSAILLNTVMSASANNQTLVGIDISPRFNNGAFTGVNNLGLRVLGNTNIIGSATASSALISGPLSVIGTSGTTMFTSNIDTLTLTGSLLLSTGSMFGLPTTSSVAPVTGSMYWSGSLLFIYNGTRYMSASFV
jgi:hypothetical protein